MTPEGVAALEEERWDDAFDRYGPYLGLDIDGGGRVREAIEPALEGGVSQYTFDFAKDLATAHEEMPDTPRLQSLNVSSRHIPEVKTVKAPEQKTDVPGGDGNTLVGVVSLRNGPTAVTEKPLNESAHRIW